MISRERPAPYQCDNMPAFVPQLLPKGLNVGVHGAGRSLEIINDPGCDDAPSGRLLCLQDGAGNERYAHYHAHRQKCGIMRLTVRRIIVDGGSKGASPGK